MQYDEQASGIDGKGMVLDSVIVCSTEDCLYNTFLRNVSIDFLEAYMYKTL